MFGTYRVFWGLFFLFFLVPTLTPLPGPPGSYIAFSLHCSFLVALQKSRSNLVGQDISDDEDTYSQINFNRRNSYFEILESDPQFDA